MTPRVRAAAFALDPGRQEARLNGVPLALDPAAFAVLCLLLDADGAVLDPAALAHIAGASRLWACVARLNEALARCAPLSGEQVYVASYPGQGYQLVCGGGAAMRLLGRAAELTRSAGLLQKHRFVTIVGPGGMGKTTLARAVAAQSAARYPDGVRFIDLAVLAEGRELVGALGAALGIDRLTRDGLSQLDSCLQGKRMLVLFDCCEHHTAVAAQASEALLRAAPGIDVLCTSREPLLAHGERIVRLGPIALPDAAAQRDAAAAARFPAVELFLARADSDGPERLTLDQRTVGLVCAICRAVEGVPLALELAAALVRPMGLEELARQTAKWLLAPSPHGGRAGDRHRTVTDVLDWSYNALAPHEQQVLRCLAVFSGGFTLEAAGTVAAGAGLDPDSVLETVLDLAGKSLVSMHPEDGARRARLLDLTREYARDKLAGSGELHAAQARHAHWLGSLMDRLERDWMDLPRGAWLDLYGPWVDDILAAIDWALGPGQQVLLGAQLTAVGFSLGDQIGVAREFQPRVRRALDLIGALGDVPAPVLLRLNFIDADGTGRSDTVRLGLPRNAEWVVRMARRSGSPMLLGASLIAIWGTPYVRGDYPASLAAARRLARAARSTGDPHLELIGQRTMAQSLHFMGRHADAHRCVALALASSDRRIPLAYQPSPVQVGTSMRIILARLLWMGGAADQARATSAAALVLAESDRPSALCQVLGMASIPVAIWCGDTAGAATLVRRLRDQATGHGLGFWLAWAGRFEHALAVIAGQADPRAESPTADQREALAKCSDHLVTFDPRLLSDAAAARCATGQVAWCLPELLRAQALGHLAADQSDAGGQAAAALRRSLSAARRQGALAWSLRSATSLAGLYRSRGAVRRARAVLQPVLARCHEGEGTADLRAARAMMALLA
jgi:predicted ATPase